MSQHSDVSRADPITTTGNDPGAKALGLGVVEHEGGGPVRLRLNGRRYRPNGLYFSIKSGRHLPHESRLELHDLWHAEVRTEVLSSWPQPFTLRFMTEGKIRQYTPDRKDLLSDGRVEVVEVKSALADEGSDYIAKLEQARSLLDAKGIGFTVRERVQIEAQPLFSAVEAVQRHRRTNVVPANLILVQDLLAGGPMAMGDLQARLGGGPQGFAILCAMVVRRVVTIDLSDGLQGRAQVELVH